MADERWISIPQMVEIVLSRYPVSRGRAEKLVKDAIASGEVRPRPEPPRASDPVLLVYDDGGLDMNLRPGAINKGGVNAEGRLLAERPSGYYSEDDFTYWLDQQFDKRKASKSNPRPRRYNNAGDAALVKEGRALVKGGMSKMAAARQLAPRAIGGSLEQRINRLRKAFGEIWLRQK
jgi:hypothetical protein